ncbi:hypothetical protein FRC08_007522 [Ceratobasidium sp. 394]|nr:hypothetical protein FRC08_007522 [Ceratobasidium sp. 394]
MSIERYILPELFREIFKHVEHRVELARYCLISKTCYLYAATRLYEWIYVYTWHRDAKKRVSMVLETLAESPRLAFHVKILDFRDFPTHLTVDEKLQLIALACRAISHCVNLLSCSWTRDGSLYTKIIESLAELKKLQSLEINGRPGPWTAWVPDDLFRFRHLQSLTLIMPVQAVMDVLPAWTEQNSETLESLVIICKSTTALNDSALYKMAPSLRGLRRLHLAGCVKITEGSVNEVLSNNSVGLQSLALESCSPHFNMSAFGTYCSEHKHLTSLSSISLTLPYYRDSVPRERWIDDVLLLLQHSPIESFQLYASSGLEDEVSCPTIHSEHLKTLVDGHPATLRRIGIQRLIVPVESLSYAVSACPRLEEVFATLRDVNRDELAQALAPGKALRNIHTTLMRDVAGSLRPLHLSTSQDVCLYVAQRCGASLQLIGAQTRVWKVLRRYVGEQTTVSLGSYSGPQIPEQFLMMRA